MVDRSEADVTRRPPAGPVVGASDGVVTHFRGIPYALPPVGDRRFRPPARMPSWTEPLRCTEHRPIAPQPWDPLDEMIDVPQLPSSEDMVHQLTVLAPAGAEPGAGLPVMVWIHGGSLTTGSCSWPCYDGSAFARDGVVFVGVNYRLHALGFLDLRDVLGEPDSVNLGLRDVLLALEWVQENIAAFGGDPGTVTIFGESAGGTLVGALTAQPNARQLFRRAILQSGANVQLIEPDESRTITANFLRLVGLDRPDRRALEELPVDRIVAVSQEPGLVEGAGRLFVPWNIHRDPQTAPRTGLDAVVQGDLVGVDLMLGWTLDESRLEWLATPPPELPGEIDRVPEALLAHLYDVYAEERPDLNEVERWMAVSSDQFFATPAIRLAEAQAQRGGTAYLYEFRWPSPVLGGRIGSAHALEIPFVFDQWVSPGFTGEDCPRELVDAMHSTWIAFARDGRPAPIGPVGGLAWTCYETGDRRVMVFDSTIRVESDPRSLERQAWIDVPTDAIGII